MPILTNIADTEILKYKGQRFYNLFDERESGSSQILCSYLTTRSGVRYDTNAVLEPTLLIHTSLVAESWIFQFTHDLP